jgi:hypothetical protein
MPTFEDNLHQLKTKVEAMIAAEQVPMVFLDLDDTLNRHFGALIEDEAVTSLRHLDEVGGLFGLDLGADICWAGERILQETDRFFPFPFMLLATGRQIYAWAQSVQAYVRLPVQAENKGQALRRLAEYLALPLDQCIFIADFPAPPTGKGQVGIDDPVLGERVGVIVNALQWHFFGGTFPGKIPWLWSPRASGNGTGSKAERFQGTFPGRQGPSCNTRLEVPC